MAGMSEKSLIDLLEEERRIVKYIKKQKECSDELLKNNLLEGSKRYADLSKKAENELLIARKEIAEYLKCLIEL